jgi:hypothetical protein
MAKPIKRLYKLQEEQVLFHLLGQINQQTMDQKDILESKAGRNILNTNQGSNKKIIIINQ